MTIRVLHVVNTMDMGGLETFIMNIYRNIDRNKVQFDFLKHRNTKSYYDDEIEKLGGRVYSVSQINPLKQNSYLKELRNFYLQHPEYTIIHSHINSFSLYPLREAKKVNKDITTVAHSHIAKSKKSFLNYRFPFVEYNKRHLKKFTSYNFACSVVAGKWLYGDDIEKENNFKIINNAIDTSKFLFNQETRERIRTQLDIQNKFVIGHVGRFNDQKNHDFIIDIFNSVKKLKKDAILLLIGDGNLKKEIQEKVNKLGLSSSVYFLGLRNDTNELLQAMDLFLMPSKFEGLPVTLIEAQASGLRCVVSTEITREVDITGLINFIDLEKSVEEWVHEIIQFDNKYERLNTENMIINSGYDAKANAKFFEKFYIKKK